jgi:hypothetical protein
VRRSGCGHVSAMAQSIADLGREVMFNYGDPYAAIEQRHLYNHSSICNGNSIRERFKKQTYHGLHLANGQLLELVSTPSRLAPMLSFPPFSSPIGDLRMYATIMPQLDAPASRRWISHERCTKQRALGIWHRSGRGSTQGRVKVHAKTHGLSCRCRCCCGCWSNRPAGKAHGELVVDLGGFHANGSSTVSVTRGRQGCIVLLEGGGGPRGWSVPHDERPRVTKFFYEVWCQESRNGNANS